MVSLLRLKGYGGQTGVSLLVQRFNVQRLDNRSKGRNIRTSKLLNPEPLNPEPRTQKLTPKIKQTT
jgi:hypothetical protein